MEKPALIEIRVESVTKPIVSWAKNPGGKLGVWTATTETFPIYDLKSTIVPKLKSHFGMYGIKVRNDAGSIDLDIELQMKGNQLLANVSILVSILFCLYIDKLICSTFKTITDFMTNIHKIVKT